MISIIVPIYNAEEYLQACIESLIRQTEEDLQLILVNDGSTDESLVIARSYAAQDARIEIYSQPHAGQSAARNNGLKHAKGEYIAFVDADDALEPDWCERHLAAIDGVDYVQSGYKRCQRSEVSNQQSAIINQKIPSHPYQFTSPCMRLYRRAAIGQLSFAEGYIYEDVLFSADLWLSGAHCRIIDYTGYLYTLNPQSTTSRPHPEAQRRVISELKSRLHNASLRGKMIIYYTIIRLKLHFIRS